MFLHVYYMFTIYSTISLLKRTLDSHGTQVCGLITALIPQERMFFGCQVTYGLRGRASMLHGESMK